MHYDATIEIQNRKLGVHPRRTAAGMPRLRKQKLLVPRYLQYTIVRMT